MIYHIENTYLRRAVMFVTVPFVVLLAGVVGAYIGARDEIKDVTKAVPRCWACRAG